MAGGIFLTSPTDPGGTILGVWRSQAGGLCGEDGAGGAASRHSGAILGLTAALVSHVENRVLFYTKIGAPKGSKKAGWRSHSGVNGPSSSVRGPSWSCLATFWMPAELLVGRGVVLFVAAVLLLPTWAPIWGPI